MGLKNEEDKAMKKVFSMFMTIALLAGVAMTGCKKDEPQEPARVQTYKMSITASKGADNNAKANGAKKVLGLDGSTLTATWAAGDQVTVFNVTKDVALGGYLVAQEDGASTTLLGDLTGTIEANDVLTLKFLSPNYGTQDGTLTGNNTSIDKVCDYATASVTVSSVSGGTIYTEAPANFANQQTIVKFTLKDKDNNADINATELAVTVGGTTYTVTPAAAASELFVALPGFSGETVTLNATSQGIYTYEKTGATFANGEYYTITVKMTEEVTTATPLTLQALTAGTIAVSSPKSGMKYSKNGGAKTAVPASITVAIGDKVRFYGNGNSITSYSGTKIAGGTAQVKAYGNMISLVKETDYTSATTLATEAFKEFFKGNTTLINASGLLLPANVTLGTSSCQSMFSGCNKMTTAPAELPAALGTLCYRSLFYNCTSLTIVPALPVTTMCEGCYYQLFRGCTALTTVPADLLPATTMERDCYYGMFYGCTNLTTVPALPATTINDHCYPFMFYNCSKITTAPVLPAQTVPDGTYQQMFKGCSKLNSVTCYLTQVDNDFTAASWLDGVAASGTFTTPSGTSWSTGVNGIPSGWTRVNLP